ncbi:hypothetical protein BJ546DRAFT_313505 [Cryomyces antarcticus]
MGRAFGFGQLLFSSGHICSWYAFSDMGRFGLLVCFVGRLEGSVNVVLLSKGEAELLRFLLDRCCPSSKILALLPDLLHVGAPSPKSSKHPPIHHESRSRVEMTTVEACWGPRSRTCDDCVQMQIDVAVEAQSRSPSAPTVSPRAQATESFGFLLLLAHDAPEASKRYGVAGTGGGAAVTPRPCLSAS